MIRRSSAWPVALLALLAACGGSGGGEAPPQSTAPALVLADAVVAPGATSARLGVALGGEAPFPVMVQFDVVADPAELELDPAVVALRAFDRLEANLVAPGRLRVVCGDATGRPGTPLASGGLVEVPVRILPGASSGPYPVRIEAIVASDADGGEPPFDAGPRAAVVRRG